MRIMHRITAAIAGITLLASLAGCSTHTARSVEWNEASITGEHTIEVKIDGGSCDTFTAELDETDTTIAISLTMLTRKGPCTMESYTNRVVVETEAPVGDRQIVDGHADVWGK